MRFADRVIASVDWGSLKTESGTAEEVGRALSTLLSATDPEALDEVDWRIEGRAFCQSTNYESAEAVVNVLVASMLDPDPWGMRGMALEQLFRIVINAEWDPSTEDGPTPVDDRIRQAALSGTWLLAREALGEHREAALEILEVLRPPEYELILKIVEHADQDALAAKRRLVPPPPPPLPVATTAPRSWSSRLRRFFFPDGPHDD